MSIWLILTPAMVWLAAATWGRHLLRAPAERLWRGMQITTSPPAYDPHRLQHRVAIGMARFQGGLLFAAALFVSVMAILVAAGIVPPGRN